MRIEQKNQKCFIFDLNRCTGCEACIIACTIENHQKQETNWRQVYTFNETRHPALPLFSLSMACNHCIDAACKKNCPALAYSKDPETGAVIHHSERCMGCQYCTWACPYDAPQYNRVKGVIEKCDFCIQRLREDDAPACVCACPTNALRIGDFDEYEKTRRIAGFTDTGIQPAIQFIDLRKQQQVPESTAPPTEASVAELFESSQHIPEPKISLKTEWPLLVFTTIAYLLVAFFTAMWPFPLVINPFLFLGAGVLGMGLTFTHLGKKFRAFRAIFNIKNSWLSREVLFFSAFLVLSGLYLLFFPYIPTIGRAAVIVGFISLFCIDKIYQVAMQVGPLNFHSAHTLLNGLYLTGILTVNGFLFGLMGVIKCVLYLYRKVLFKQTKKKTRPLVTLLRIGFGFLVPFILLLLSLDSEHMIDYYGYVIVSVIIGEVIDRTEYYNELDIVTPRKQMLMDLEALLNRKRTGKKTRGSREL
jgi:Fe-S-cluster-containing dehydrogenase component/DMSO reductase anchor subunit